MKLCVCVLRAASIACVLFPVAAFGQPKIEYKIERKAEPKLQRAAAIVAPAATSNEIARPATLLSSVTLADVGFASGLRFSNLGGRREIFVPLPSGASLSATELVLALDDVSAHEAKRSIEILINGRSATSIALDGRSNDRVVRVPLSRVQGHEGFLKLTFVYSGAATQDRCIDVRSIGDSLTVRPESSIEIEIGSPSLDVATTAALMPRDVAVVLSSHAYQTPTSPRR